MSNENSKQLIKDIKTAILRWYPFENGEEIAYIGEADPIFEMLKDRFGEMVIRYSVNEEIRGMYDDIVCIRCAEDTDDLPSFLRKVRARVKDGGRLLLGMNNRMGIRYFCGDRDPYTDRSFDGIEDYFRAYMGPEDNFAGRSYDKSQLEEMLGMAGFTDNRFYSVFPDLDHASFLFADGYIPNEDLSIRIFPAYNSPETVFLEEERLYTGLLKNGLFHTLANAYLIESSTDGRHTDALQITNSPDRGREDSMITIIHENDTVTKQAAFPEGRKKTESLDGNMKYLASRGIAVVAGELKNRIYTMPLVKAETGMVYLSRLVKENPELFLQKLDEFRDEIMKASDITDEDGRLVLERAPVDMIPLNSFYEGDRFVFFDQEFLIERFPLEALLYRVLVSVYDSLSKQQQSIPRDRLYARYGIDINDAECVRRIEGSAMKWLRDLRKEDELSEYYETVRRDNYTVNENRQRMNYPAEDYQKLFVDIFGHADSGKLFLFGSGNFAKRFLSMYGKDYRICAVIDNNEKRYGQKLFPEGSEEGIEICSPEILKTLRSGEYKVIICIKNYVSVMKQLDAMGIREYSIFDPAKAYPRKRHPLTSESRKCLENSTVREGGGKKYHIGYVAGVFDLFHIGHLNMFRRAKEMCDYLIVGVVSDEGVKYNKGSGPFVPLAERIEMVSSCRYVDEVVEIPYMYGGTEDAWKMHHFDVQFSGSDYANDPGFAKYKAFLEKHGAVMEFFPYTESTSSTKLKALIEKKLL